jgi:putative SOS response-associated peptidase YedK
MRTLFTTAGQAMNRQMKDNLPFVFAGLWKGWSVPPPQNWLHTRTIITGESNDLATQDFRVR